MQTTFLNKTGPGKLKLIGALAIVIIVAVTAVLFFWTKEKETIKIGAIISLTGAGSHLVDLRDAMLMAADEVNSHGGVNGRKIELLIEDNKTNPEEAIKVFERLENSSKKPLIYVSALSSIGMALSPLAEKNQVVLVGLVTSAPDFTRQSSWVFRHYTNSAEEVRVAQRILDDLKVQQLGIIYLDDPYGNSVADLLEKRFIGKGGAAIKAAFPGDATDLGTQVEAIKDLPAVYAVGLVKHIAMALKQLRQANYQGIVMISSGSTNPMITSLSEAEGVYIGSPKAYNPNYPFAQEFKKNFETKHQKPFSFQAANGYDFVKIFAGLIEGQEISRQNIKNILGRGFMYSGVLGDQELKPGGQEIFFPLFPARIQDNKIKFLRQ